MWCRSIDLVIKVWIFDMKLLIARDMSVSLVFKQVDSIWFKKDRLT